MSKQIGMRILVLTGLLSGSALFSQKLSYPSAKTDLIIENRHGITYLDSYRWMENLHDPDLAPWVRQQNQFTQRYLKNSDKNILYQEFIDILSKKTDKDFPADSENYLKRHRYIERVRAAENSDKFSEFSSDKRFRIHQKSDSSSDLKTVLIEDTSTGSYLSDSLTVKFADFFWEKDNKSFIYTSDQDGRVGDHFPVIRRHVLGQDQSKDQILLKADSTDSWLGLVPYQNRFLLLMSKGLQTSWHWFDPDSGLGPLLIDETEGELTYISEHEGQFYFLDYANADMGRIIKYDISSGKIIEIVAEKNFAIDQVTHITDQLFVTYLKNTENILFHHDLTTNKTSKIPFVYAGSIVVSEREKQPYIYFTSYHEPLSGWVFDRQKMTLIQDMPAEPTPFPIESFRIFYKAHNKKQAAIWIIKHKDTQLNRNTPVYLYGYGGFRINIKPGFVKQYQPWLKRGGVIAVATLPGGLEMGEKWHRAGALNNKGNVFKDFASAAKTLFKLGYTSRGRLAIGGGSNGGLLVAATVNRYPKLFKAAVPEVGVLDMTSFEIHTGGKWWMSEYGSRKNSEQFINLMKVSPYHNIRNQKYPDILAMTADLDDRVVPSHSYKYVAKLQSWDFSGQISLLYTKRNGSHSSRSGTIEAQADYLASKWSFMLKSLNISSIE